MKNNFPKFIALGVFLFLVLGCSLISKIQREVEKTQQPKIFISTDGSCQITTPGSWSKETTLNDQATLQASNRLSEQYVVIIRENRLDFGKMANLSMVTNAIQDNLKKTLTNPVLTTPVNVNINGYPAQQFEASGEYQNIKAKYLYGVVETPQNYYQIITWSLASRFDENRPRLLEVINSFKETGASSTSTPFSAKPASGK
jgi:hypothetical protein